MNQQRTNNSNFVNTCSEIIVAEENETFDEAMLAAAAAYVNAVNDFPGECWSVVIEEPA